VARRRRRAKFGRKTKKNLMLHRTRNLGVVGTRGAGVIAHTKGPFISMDGGIVIDPTESLLTESGYALVNESRTANIIPESVT